MRYPVIVNNTVSKCLLALLPVMLTVAALPAHAKMYKWVDAQGNVHYSDTLPPASAGRGNSEISKTGRTVKKTESADEKRARMAREAEAAEKKKLTDEQARKDRALLSTYTTEQEIDLARNRALEHHSLAIKSAQIRLKPAMDNAAVAANMVRARKAANKSVPPDMQQQLDARLAEVEVIRGQIKTNEEAQVAVRARYDADRQRFRELKGLPVPAATTPAPIQTQKTVAPVPAKPAAKP